MDKTNPKPIDPETPRARSVKSYPLNKLYPQPMEDDVYVRPDNDSIYTPIDLDKVNKLLDEISDEDNSKNH